MKKLSNETIILLVLSGLLVVGIAVGAARHFRHNDMVIESVSSQPAKININQASCEELTVLPGIGPQLASRIVEYRNAHGDFKTIDSLANVQGIGQAKIEDIKPYLEVP